MERKTTLVVVDFQYDFCLLGAPLYVPGSNRALWNISDLIENKKVDRVIFTADWHPANHCSFKRNGGEWNDHCIQFSKGAAIHDLLLYGCISSGVSYRVLIKGELPSSEEYGVKVAVSSTWRSDSNLQEVFNLVGIKEPIHDITPYMRSRHRGSEIQEWLDKQTEPYRYVIFDDDTDMLDSQLPYFIQSDWLKWGLSDEDVEQAIHILNDTNTTAETHL